MPSYLGNLSAPLPKPINLDQAAGHATKERYGKQYAELIRRYPYNPHGLTCYAEESRRALNLAKRTILRLVGASETDTALVWCANGTEALNLALRGFPFDSPDDILAVDLGGHHALTETANALNGPQHGFLLDDTGAIPLPLPTKTRLVALSLVNNETGLIWDGDRKALPQNSSLLVDACQAFGKHPIPWEEAHIDLLVLSSRKLGGPATGACLLYRRNLRLKPLLTGGGQQDGLLSGTLDTAGCLLFAAAAEEACENAPAALAHVTALNARLREGLQRIGNGSWPIFSPEDASPYILYFAIPGYQGALVARLLAAEHQILVGTGSACTAESGDTSALLRTKGIADDLARSAIRISFAPENTLDDIDRLLHALPQTLKNY